MRTLVKWALAAVVIDIEEAQPIDGWQLPVNVKEHITIASAHSFSEWEAAAKTCMVKLCINIPAIVDNIHDTTEIAYTGWPGRLYVITRDGRIAYKSNLGPYGFIPNEVGKNSAATRARHWPAGCSREQLPFEWFGRHPIRGDGPRPHFSFCHPCIDPRGCHAASGEPQLDWAPDGELWLHRQAVRSGLS